MMEELSKRCFTLNHKMGKIKEISMKKRLLLQEHNQIILDQYKNRGSFCLGPYSSYTWRNDPKHLMFSLARYKFCSKMLAGKKKVLEVGCGDAFGVPMLLQTVESVHGVDIEKAIIEDNIERYKDNKRVSFQQLDITKAPVNCKFGAIVSLDVIEHISPRREQCYMANICHSLKPEAVCIIGTPNITASHYASKNSNDGHINLKSHDTLSKALAAYFTNVFIFSMNDEMVHTGFYPMANFLIGMGVGVRKKEK